MPHQCVRCNRFHEDGSQEILKGCPCGSKLFFFIKKERLEALQESNQLKLTDKQRIEIEEDVWDMVGSSERSEPIVLNLENIRISKPGQYEIDLVNLFQNEPLVFRLEEGKYMIDLAETFQRMSRKKK